MIPISMMLYLEYKDSDFEEMSGIKYMKRRGSVDET